MPVAYTERHNFRVHVSLGSAETLVRRGGIINHSIAYSLSNISAKNYRNRLMRVESILCNISVVFWGHSVQLQDRISGAIILISLKHQTHSASLSCQACRKTYVYEMHLPACRCIKKNISPTCFCHQHTPFLSSSNGLRELNYVVSHVPLPSRSVLVLRVPFGLSVN